MSHASGSITAKSLSFQITGGELRLDRNEAGGRAELAVTDPGFVCGGEDVPTALGHLADRLRAAADDVDQVRARLERLGLVRVDRASGRLAAADDSATTVPRWVGRFCLRVKGAGVLDQDWVVDGTVDPPTCTLDDDDELPCLEISARDLEAVVADSLLPPAQRQVGGRLVAGSKARVVPATLTNADVARIFDVVARAWGRRDRQARAVGVAE